MIGGGHAGAEAAWACANLLPRDSAGTPATVGLVTLSASKIGVMSCNPAIGGQAKGQIVREIDAMGGLMGLAADATGIHFKMLNTSKGAAVHGPRCQSDKHAYAEAVQGLLSSRPEIEVVEGAVESLTITGGAIRGVVIKLPSGETIALDAKAVVLTTGTFMRGLMHTGEMKSPGGRAGEAPSVGLSAALAELGFELGRLKTGTPPRIRRGSIDWESLPEQWGDAEPAPFSDLSAEGWSAGAVACDRFPLLEQIACRQTRTTPAVHEIIRANLHRAPMFSGQIESRGPRYCPSIEDKCVRFADREEHGVFLEPESLRDDWVYCNGIATSLPTDVQDEIVRRMPGCERAEILLYGYAVEYDMVRPHQIMATGETRRIAGLFLAGQINGTSGYEEAAAQGLIAGINAARRARGDGEFTLARHEAYIGVLMDDLVTKTPVEPYRMFTSRAEHRLLLRADNSADRLTPIADAIGLLGAGSLGASRRERFERRTEQLALLQHEIDGARIDGVPLGDAVRRPGFAISDLRASLPGVRVSADVWATAHAQRVYEPYIRRQEGEIRRQRKLESRRLPDDLAYDTIASLGAEARQALTRFRPATFAQAGRLEGVTPADLTLLAVVVERRRRGDTPAA